MLIATAAFLTSSFALPTAPLPRDQHAFNEPYDAPTTEASFVFNCRGYSVSMRYVRHSDTTQGDIASARRMRLAGLSYNRRAFRSAQIVRGRQLFSSFAWINRVSGRCYREEVLIFVEGVSRQAWLDLVSGVRTHPLPTSLSTLRVGRRGVEEAE
jgi:hypothetical protein